MKTIVKNLIIVFVIGLSVSACKVYTVSVESLSKQISQSNPEKKRMQIGSIFFLVHDSIYSNGLQTLLCYDKKGDEKAIAVNAGTEIRFTNKEGKHTVFYFDSIVWGDSIVSGCTSRFLGTRKEIAREGIQKIEIANDKKGIRYN